MRLGTRWPAGTLPPATVPEVIRAGITEAEANLLESDRAAYWTLTWLENRPIAELDAGWEVFLSPDGTVVVQPFDD